MAEQPFLSIVIPTYRRERELRETLHSLLAQDYTEREIIVVDQTPTHDRATRDLLSTLAEKGKIRWLRKRRANLPAARNVGVAAARGEVVVFLDDDAILTSGLLERYARRFQRDPALAGVCGLTMEPGQKPDDAPPLPCMVQVARDRVDLPLCNYGTRVANPLHFVGANMAYRRDVILAAGGFSEVMTGSALGEDIEFAGRVRRMGGRTLYDPRLALWHHRGLGGGCRQNALNSFSRSRDRNRNYYFALLHGAGWRVGGCAIWRRWQRMFRAPDHAPVQSNAALDATPDRNRLASWVGRVVGAVEALPLVLFRSQRQISLEALTPGFSIDVVIPTYGRDEPLLDSIRSLVPQRAEFDRLLIIAQGTMKPETRRALIDWERDGVLELYREEVTGASRARNVGAALSRAEVLLFLDDDIIAHPGLIAAHRSAYATRDVTAAGGRIAWTGDQVLQPLPFAGTAQAACAYDAPVCYHGTPFPHVLHAITCNMSIRRDALVAAGGFLEWFRGGGEDLELNSRLAGRIVYAPEAVVVHRSWQDGGTRPGRTSIFSAAYGKFLAFHVSALRAVGVRGWLAVQVRRWGRLLVRTGGTGASAVAPPRREPRRPMRKVVEVLASMAAVPSAFWHVWRLRHRRGDYAGTAIAVRRRRKGSMDGR